MTYELSRLYMNAVIKLTCDECNGKIPKYDRYYNEARFPSPRETDDEWLLDDSSYSIIVCMDCRRENILRRIAQTAVIPKNDDTEIIVKWAMEIVQYGRDVRDNELVAGLLERTIMAERTQS